MKRLFLALVMAVFSVGAFAQFDQGTKYINTSLSNLNLSYSKNTKLTLGLDATAGYFFEDAWMLLGRVGYDHQYVKGPSNDMNTFSLGAGARYYIRQNGLYLGAGAKYEYLYNGSSNNNIFLTPELGYCYYLNNYLSVEPAVYYDISLNHFADASKIGLRLGFGFYF